jgi:hypothetical protein
VSIVQTPSRDQHGQHLQRRVVSIVLLINIKSHHWGAELNLSVAERNSSSCRRWSSSSVMPLCSILVCFFSRFCARSCQRRRGYGRGMGCSGPYLLCLLVVCSNVEDGGHVLAKVELLEGGLDVFAGDCLFGVLFGNLVGFGGNEGDELDAALDEEVARVLGKGHARLGGQNVLDNLLDGRWGTVSISVGRAAGGGRRAAAGVSGTPLGSDRSSLPPNSRSDMVEGVCAESGADVERWVPGANCQDQWRGVVKL